MGKRKILGKDSMGVQKTMRFTDYLGDGLGQLPLLYWYSRYRKVHPVGCRWPMF